MSINFTLPFMNYGYPFLFGGAFNYGMPFMPLFNFGFGGFSAFAPNLSGLLFDFRKPQQTNQGGAGANVSSTNETKDLLNDISKMKYDDTGLKAKLDKLKNPEEISAYISGNGHKLANTITAGDGGKIYIYKDADGNLVGSIRKNSDEKIENIGLHIADEGQVSLNYDSEGKVTSRIVMSKNNEKNEKTGKTFEQLYSNLLNGEFKNIQGVSEKRKNGDVLIRYGKEDGKYLFVNKDKTGKITTIDYSSENTKTNQTLNTFVDQNNNGKIDNGEQKVRYDIKI